MRGAGLMMMRTQGGGSTTFIGANSTPVISPQALTFPAGTQGTDYAFIFLPFGAQIASITGGAGGWTADALNWTNYGYAAKVWRKQLESGDLAGVTLSGATNSDYMPVLVGVWRGPTAATLRSSNPGAVGTTCSLTGFTKSPSSKGLVSFVSDRDANLMATPPAGFSGRLSAKHQYFTDQVADLLVPSNYINGAAVEWTDFQNGTDQIGFLYELS
jgi:hypothetical protein